MTMVSLPPGGGFWQEKIREGSGQAGRHEERGGEPEERGERGDQQEERSPRWWGLLCWWGSSGTFKDCQNLPCNISVPFFTFFAVEVFWQRNFEILQTKALKSYYEEARLSEERKLEVKFFKLFGLISLTMNKWDVKCLKNFPFFFRLLSLLPRWSTPSSSSLLFSFIGSLASSCTTILLFEKYISVRLVLFYYLTNKWTICLTDELQ